MSKSGLLPALFVILCLAACSDEGETASPQPAVPDSLLSDAPLADAETSNDVPSTDATPVNKDADAALDSGPDAAEPIGVRVRHCDDPALSLEDAERAALAAAGFTQCATPFGVLLAADDDMPPAYVTQAAQVLAELLDQDMDGFPEDPSVAEVVADHQSAWLAMPMDPEAWESTQLPLLWGALGYDIVIPAWWLEPKPNGPDEHGRAVMVEEIHHFLTQFGYSLVYPEVFGVEDWSSIIAVEALAAQCDYWQHPENSCPGSPPSYPGDCSDPSCDVVEFYHQVAVMRAGMTPAWLGIGFPTSAEGLEAKLSDAIKSVMDDPAFHQLQAPLSFGYPTM